VLTGTNTYTGGTTINKGVLQLGDGGTTGSIIGDVKNYGSLVFDRSDDVSFNGIVSGNGSLRQAGTGTVTLAGANTYTGGTTISAGTLRLGNGGTTGSIVGDVKNDGSLVFDRSDNVTFDGVISGSGSLEQSSRGTLTLTGTNTYTGGTTINNGTLQLGHGGATGSIAGDVTDNGALRFNRSDDMVFNNIVSGSGSLVQAGTGRLTLTGANTYADGTTVEHGILDVAAGATLGTGSVTVGSFDIDYYESDFYSVPTLQLDSGVSLSNAVVLIHGALDNAGILDGNLDNAVLGAGDLGTVRNHDGGSIKGKNSAVLVGSIGPGTVYNSSGGIIEGGSLGVRFGYGGTISNDGVGSTIRSSAGIAVKVSGNNGAVTNTGGGIIIGGSTAIYLQYGGSVINGSGSTIKTTGARDGDCEGAGDCAIFAASNLTLVNAGVIVGNVQMFPTTSNSVTLSPASSIQGDLNIGSRHDSFLELNGDAGTDQLYSQAVIGTTTFAGDLTKRGDGTWIIDNNDLTPDTVAIHGGTLQIGNGGTEGSISQGDVNIYHGKLAFDRSDDVVFDGSISSGHSEAYDGTLVQAGAGVLTLLMAGNDISPTHIMIESGTLQIDNTGDLPSGCICVSYLGGRVVNDGALVFNSNRTIYGGLISGSGSVTQNGSGYLILQGQNTYTGGTMINDGVVLAQEVLPGNVAVNVGGTLDGSLESSSPNFGAPGMAGNLFNAGKVSVRGGDSLVGGNYTQASTGTLAVSLGSELNVTGMATLNGGTLEVTGADIGYVTNTHTNVLTATGGVTGTFGQLVKDTGVVFTATTINYDANSVWLDTTGLDVTTAAAGDGVSYTPASFGSARRVQGAFEQLDATISDGELASVSSDFVRAAGQFQQAPTLQAAQASLQSLSGQLHAVSAAMTFEAIDASSRALSDRFDNLLAQGTGFGMWTHDLSVGGDMARAGFDAVGFQLNGWLVGSDRQIGHSGVAGFAFGQSQGQQRLNRSVDHDSSRNTEAMLYAGALNGSWYTQGRVGFGRFQQDVSRQLLLGGSAQGVWTQYGGSYDVAYGESGLHFAGGKSQITPFVDVQYARVHRDGFSEQGAGGFGLRSNAQALDRWQAGLGVRAGHHWNLDGGRAVDLSARAQWLRTLASHGDVFDASFVGLQHWQPIAGIGLSRYSGLFGLAMDATLSARMALTFNYDYQTGQRNQAQMLSARLNVAF
jgi:fibronectin-binding autotransporter adhesin